VQQSQLYDCFLTLAAEKTVNISNERPPPVVIKKSLRESTASLRNQTYAAAGKIRILVAEDNVINREVAIAQLENLGYSPDVVSNGREAVERLKISKYGIVLMDCQMPEMDGFEATAEIRRLEGDVSHTIIIALTANDIDGDREKCLAAGMDDYLSKPIKIETLRQKIEQWNVTAIEKSDSSPEQPQPVCKKELHKIVDLSVLEGYRDFQQLGEPDLVNELIDLFAEDTTARLSVIRQAVIDNDLVAIKKETHNLKSAAGNIGAFQMAGICGKLEQKALKTADTYVLISKLEAEFKQVVEILGPVRRS